MTDRRRKVQINARFLGEPLTGVQRFGREILREWEEMLEEGEIEPARYRFELLLPRMPEEPLPYRHLEPRARGPFGSHVWEQLVLPRMARGFLVNLKNTAPIGHPDMAVVIHDLQVYVTPQTYSRAFVRLYRFLLPRAAHKAKVVLVPSESTAREVERWLELPAAHCVVTSEGHEHILREPADPSILERHGLGPGSYLLAVSSLNPNKNFASILLALEKAGLDEVPLVIAGGTNPRVFEDSDLARLPPGALHVGRVGDGELRALYENAMGFLFPSFHEGFGLPPLEAMALGCPVILSRTSSLPEVGGDAALYCDPADVSDLARQITRLVHDPALRRELSAKGRLRAQGFRWRDAARRIWTAIEPHIPEA